MSKEAIEHYEAALKEAFPSGATGNVFHHWNEARKALAEQPAQQEPVALPCCGYTNANAFKWNPYNQVVQCHNCGQVYTSPPASKPLTDEEIEQPAQQALDKKAENARELGLNYEPAHGITKGGAA